MVEIQITPALAGVQFALDKHEFVSDQQGVARIEVNRVGDYPLVILPITSSNADSRIEFSRWLDEVFTPDRKVTIPLRGPLHVGFNVYKRVSQRFLDLESKPVDSGRITSLLLKSSQGMAFNLTDNQPRWMQASSVARRTTGLEETKIQYSVDSVLVDGSNVVNQSQQRFYVQANDVWPIQLLLYTAQFQARDALFKFPIGSGIHIEHPGGRIEEIPFGPNAELSIGSLVRGIYRVNVFGALGISPISPIALSRDQDVQLLVISYLDIGIGAVLAAALSFGLLFIGRPKLFSCLGSQGCWCGRSQARHDHAWRDLAPGDRSATPRYWRFGSGAHSGCAAPGRPCATGRASIWQRAQPQGASGYREYARRYCAPGCD